MIYSKTIYVEVEAEDEEAADALIEKILHVHIGDETNEISYIDFEGPIEEAQS